MSTLDQDESNTRYYLHETLSDFDPGGSPLRIWEGCEDMATKFHVLALYRVLLDLDISEFCRLASKSGQCWLYYLMRVFLGLASLPQYHCLSNNGAFFGVLAGGDFETATMMSLFTLKHFNADVENLDDFLYTLFLHQLLLQDVTASQMEEVLADYKKERDSIGPTARLAICDALWQRDSEAFHAAMESLALEREEEIETEKTARNRLEYIFAVRRHLFSEGIALARLAKWLGMRVDRDYRFVPLDVHKYEIQERSDDQVPQLTASERKQLLRKFDAIDLYEPYRVRLREYLRAE